MRRLGVAASLALVVSLLSARPAAADGGIKKIDPPEQGFYSKRLDYAGIPIKASAEVSDEALTAAYARLFMELHLLPAVVENLKSQGSELHLIGKDQVTSDLPENRALKGKPFDGSLDVDERTRGLGGVVASCGEENLLGLEQDRYHGRDICIHEYAHTIHVYGLTKEIQDMILKQFQRSTAKGLWKGLYGGTNEREYFAELTMWYFGTHGDTAKLVGPWEPGPRWLRGYDPEGFELVERIYSGKLEVKKKRFVALAKLSPEREKGLRAYGGEPVTVTFLNHTDRPVRVYWLDYKGRRKSYGTIPPRGRQLQNTFSTHPFLITDEEDRGLVIFVAGTEPATATIDGAQPPQ